MDVKQTQENGAGIGKGTPGPGRPAGSANKFTANIKGAFEEAFEQLGGVEGLTAWARENQGDFYRMVARMLPTNLKADVSADVKLAEKPPLKLTTYEELRDVERTYCLKHRGHTQAEVAALVKSGDLAKVYHSYRHRSSWNDNAQYTDAEQAEFRAELSRRGISDEDLDALAREGLLPDAYKETTEALEKTPDMDLESLRVKLLLGVNEHMVTPLPFKL